MTEVVSVRFKNKGKVYFFDPAGLTVSTGDNIIVETAKGVEYACCTYGNHYVEDNAVIPPLRPVVRIATPADDKMAEDNKQKESEAFAICQEKILKHGMDMKLVDVEYNFDGNKILFFFTSDGRVDFRDLVKDLASVFKARIELRQIGVRDEARMLGGLGICGRPFCCAQFLDEFQPVSIKMAKVQGLSLNPTKISGTCGRLMCCLKYEQCAYEDLVKNAPKVDAFVESPGGKGSVVSVNLLRGNASVRLESQQDTSLKTYSFDELEVLGGKGRREEYIAAKAEGRLEEAGFLPSKPPELKLDAFLKPSSPGSKSEQEQKQEQKPAMKSKSRHDQRKKSDTAHKPSPQQQAEPETANASSAEEKSGAAPYKKPSRRRRPSHSKPKTAGATAAHTSPEKQAQPKNGAAKAKPENTAHSEAHPDQKKQTGAKRPDKRYYRKKRHHSPGAPKQDQPNKE